MKDRIVRHSIVAAAVVGVLSLMLVSWPAAQTKPPVKAVPQNDRKALQKSDPASRPTPRTPDGHPDLSGFYGINVAGITNARDDEVILTRTADGSIFYDYAGSEGGGGHPDDAANRPAPTNQASYKPEYMAKVIELSKTMYGGDTTRFDPIMSCHPNGVPRTSIGTMLIVQHPKYIALLYENQPGPQFRVIYTDGRKHPADYDTSFMGHSIGHWEGDTLVVDTVGLNEDTWLGGGVYTTIHSDQEHVVERWTRKGDDLKYEAVVEDPIMFTKPWVLPARHTQIGLPDDYIQPQMCNTNDRDHLIQETETDKFQCNWCQKDADTVYGQGAADRDREIQAQRANRPAGARAGGDE